MSKADTLAKLVSTGGPLANGAITVSDISGLQTTLDGKLALSGGTLTGNLTTTTGVISPIYAGVANTSGNAGPVTLQAGTGTGQAGTSGGNGYVYIAGGGATNSWTSFNLGLLARRRGGILLQAGTAAADANATYVNGSTINILGSNGTTNGTLYGFGSQVLLTAGGATTTTASINSGGGVNMTGATPGQGGSVNIIGGSGSGTGNTNGGPISIIAGGAGNGLGLGGSLTLRAGSSDTGAAGSTTIAGGTTVAGVAGYVRINTADNERMRIDAAGNVGIGTDTPNVKLQVHAGTSNFDDFTAIRMTNGGESGTNLDFYNTFGPLAQIKGTKLASGSNADEGVMTFSTATNSVLSEKMRLDSSGNVGIGVVPSAWSNAGGIDFPGFGGVGNWGLSGNGVLINTNVYYTSGAYRYKQNNTAHQYAILTGGHQWYIAPSGTAGNAISFTTAMTLDGNGNWKIGTTGFGTRAVIAGTNTAVNTTVAGSNTGMMFLYDISADANAGPEILMGSSYDGTNSVVGTAIKSYKVPGVGSGSNQYEHGLIFKTSNFSSGLAERARIDSSGNLLVGTTTPNGKISSSSNFSPTTAWATTSAISVSGSFGGGIAFIDGVKGYAQYCSDFGNDFYIQGNAVGSTPTGGVYLNDYATSWSSASDENVKDIIEPITNATEKVRSLRAVIGKYKHESENKRHPFLIAQDVQAVLPEAVSIMNKGQENECLGLSYTDTIPLLVAAIKEQQEMITQQSEIITTLTARVAALESN
jgi:hypothetical protein